MAEKVLHSQHAMEAFPSEALQRIAKTIAEVEHSTHAELRISIRDVREVSEADLTVRELALKEFATLGMHETADRRGILLLILFDERKFYILGDEGVSSHVNPETWDDVAKTLGGHFRKGEFEEGVHQALHRIKHHLHGILPKRAEGQNELSDEVVIS